MSPLTICLFIVNLTYVNDVRSTLFISSSSILYTHLQIIAQKLMWKPTSRYIFLLVFLYITLSLHSFYPTLPLTRNTHYSFRPLVTPSPSLPLTITTARLWWSLDRARHPFSPPTLLNSLARLAQTPFFHSLIPSQRPYSAGSIYAILYTKLLPPPGKPWKIERAFTWPIRTREYDDVKCTHPYMRA